jgi:DNA-binding transcriptional ArsR family regulator
MHSKSTVWLTFWDILNHMIDSDLDGVFHALAHPARRELVTRLSGGQLTVGELAAPLRMSLAAASKHLDVLERAGLVRRTAHGRTRVCSLNPAPLAGAARWLRLDAAPPAAPGGAAGPQPEAVFRSGPLPDG